MNQLGDEGGRIYNRRPYEDYTGYAPINTPWEVKNASRWQPRYRAVALGFPPRRVRAEAEHTAVLFSL